MTATSDDILEVFFAGQSRSGLPSNRGNFAKQAAALKNALEFAGYKIVKIEKATDRGSGQTTRQILNAPQKAIFVWCNPFTEYPKHLAAINGRADLEIVGPAWLENQCYKGRELTGLVLDHAMTGRFRLAINIDEAQLRIRP